LVASLKAELEEVYEELRNKKTEADELRRNIYDVNRMFT